MRRRSTELAVTHGRQPEHWSASLDVLQCPHSLPREGRAPPERLDCSVSHALGKGAGADPSTPRPQQGVAAGDAEARRCRSSAEAQPRHQSHTATHGRRKIKIGPLEALFKPILFLRGASPWGESGVVDEQLRLPCSLIPTKFHVKLPFGDPFRGPPN